MENINENHEFMADGKVDILDPQVLVALNAGLAEATAMSAITPYIAWGKVQKVLAMYHIFIPNTFLEGSEGNEVIPINQFGKRFGQTNDGDYVVNDESKLFLYFEWEQNERGLFTIFAEVVEQDDLEEILDDYDEEVAAVNEASELKMGMKDEKEEHHMSDEEAKRTAKQHLKKNPKYYSILKKVGLEEVTYQRAYNAEKAANKKAGEANTKKWNAQFANNNDEAEKQDKIASKRFAQARKFKKYRTKKDPNQARYDDLEHKGD